MNPVETVRGFYAALAEGDVPAVLDLLAPALAWTEAARFPYASGTWTTPQQVLDRLLVPLSQDWKGFAATPDRFLPSGDSVVALGAYSGVNRASGRVLHAPFAHVWEVRDGRITRFDQYTDTVLVREAL